MHFSSEVEITTQRIDYCFESDNRLHWSFSLTHTMGDCNFRWVIVFTQQKNKLNQLTLIGNFCAQISETAERKQSAIPLGKS